MEIENAQLAAHTASSPAPPRAVSAPRPSPRRRSGTPKRFRERSEERRRSPTPTATSRPPHSPEATVEAAVEATPNKATAVVPDLQRAWISTTDASLSDAERAHALRVIQIRKEMAMRAAASPQMSSGPELASPQGRGSPPVRLYKGDRGGREPPPPPPPSVGLGKPSGFAAWPSWKRKKWEWQHTHADQSTFDVAVAHATKGSL